MACWSALGLLVVVYVISIGSRYLINDDYQTLYTAWLKSQGMLPGRDYYLTSYYLLVDLVAPLFKVVRNSWFPIYFMRCFFLGILCWTLMLLARLSGRLFDRGTGLLVPAVLLSTTAMLHRGLDIRPDLITNLLWFIIFLNLLGESPLARKSVRIVGILLAIATLNRFKGLLIVPLLAGAYGFHLWREPRGRLRSSLRILADLALGALAVLLPYFLWVVATDGLAEFVKVNMALFTDLNHARSQPNQIMADTFRTSLRLEYLFWGLAALGIALRWLGRRMHSLGANLFALGILLTGCLTVVLNPAYYSYNLMTLQALLAPFAAYGLLRTIGMIRGWVRGGWQAVLVTGVLVLLPALWNWQAVAEVIMVSNAHQKALNTFLLRYTRPDQRVFAMEGVGLFRPSLFHWRIPAVLIGRYVNGEWSYAKEMREQSPEIIVRSYRVPGWLTRPDLDFINEHYVLLTPQILVPGAFCAAKPGAAQVELLVPGRYEILVKGQELCRLDGIPVRNGDLKDLSQGHHQVETGLATMCLIRKYYPPEARELIRNPEGLPYFTPPGMGLPVREVDPRFTVN